MLGQKERELDSTGLVSQCGVFGLIRVFGVCAEEASVKKTEMKTADEDRTERYGKKSERRTKRDVAEKAGKGKGVSLWSSSRVFR